jgi:hypothetical protein
VAAPAVGAVVAAIAPYIVSAIGKQLGKSTAAFNAQPYDVRKTQMRAVLRSKYMWINPGTAVLARQVARNDAAVTMLVDAVEDHGAKLVKTGTEKGVAMARRKNPTPRQSAGFSWDVNEMPLTLRNPTKTGGAWVAQPDGSWVKRVKGWTLTVQRARGGYEATAVHGGMSADVGVFDTASTAKAAATRATRHYSENYREPSYMRKPTRTRRNGEGDKYGPLVLANAKIYWQDDIPGLRSPWQSAIANIYKSKTREGSFVFPLEARVGGGDRVFPLSGREIEVYRESNEDDPVMQHDGKKWIVPPPKANPRTKRNSGKSYDTRVKPALRALERAVIVSDPLNRVKAAIDAAAQAGASKREIVHAVGGSDAWSGLLRALRSEGLT